MLASRTPPDPGACRAPRQRTSRRFSKPRLPRHAPGADQNFLAPSANIEKRQSSDSGHPGNVRAEAARTLGSLDLPKGYTMLLDSFELYVRPNKANGGHKLAEDILVALGKRSIEETAEFFDRLLLDSKLSDEFREL